MAGRGKTDKSERRNNHPAAKPSDLDQFGQAIDEQLTDVEDCPAQDDERK
ncbi:hypothetical protein LOK74_13235 [Brevibacillus humidisoli]|nr:hypothetical protein [Brevibacillus humidisoli]UFJ39041.1 hypothetical protein LOK74_13235 [Brevibacillus humidisoli]